MKHKAVVLFLALLYVSVMASSAGALSGETTYESAMRALNEGNLQGAIKLFTQVLAANPRDHRALNDRGIAYKRIGDLDRSLDDFSQAVRIKPDFPHAYNNRGLVHLERGNFEAALRDFEEALRLGGTKSKIHTNLGIAKAKKGDHRGAVQEFKLAAQSVPVDIRSYLYMGDSLEKLGAQREAAEAYQLALSVINDQATARDLEKKIADLTRSETTQHPAKGAESEGPGVKTSPQSPVIPRRDIVRAQPVSPPIKTIQDTKPSSPLLTAYPSSVEELENTVRTRIVEKFAPNSAEIYRQGMQFAKQGDSKKALIRFEDTLQIEKRRKNLSGSAWCLIEIGRAYRTMGDHRKAEENLDAALSFFRRNPGSDELIVGLLEMAATKKATGQHERATHLYAEAAREAENQGNQHLAQGIRAMASGSSQRNDQAKPSEKPVIPDTSHHHPSLLSETGGSKETTAGDQETLLASSKPQPSESPSPPTSVVQETEAKNLEASRNSPQSHGDASTSQKTSLISALKKETLEQRFPKPLPRLTPRIAETEPGKAFPSAASETSSKETGGTVIPSVAPLQEKAVPKKQLSPNPRGTLTTTSPTIVATTKSLISTAEKEGPRRNLRQYLTDLKKYREAGDELSMIYLLERLAELYSRDKEWTKAYHCLLASLAFREKLSVTKGAEKLYRDRGVIREHLGDYCGALEDLTRAMYHAERLQSKEAMSGIAVRAEKIAANIGLEASEVLAAYRALWKARESGDEKAETDALYLLGKVYDKAERTTEAISYYDRSTASLLATKARMYEKMGKKDLADKAFNEALDAFKKLDYSRYLNMLKTTSLAGQFSFQE